MFVWPSEQFWKIFGNLWKVVEIFGKSSKTPSSVSLYNKQNNTWTLGDMEFIFSCSHSISHLFAALTRSISMWTLEDNFHISAWPCIILYVSQSKLAWLTPNLGILCISVCSFWLCGSIVAYPIISRLVSSPSRFEIRQLLRCFYTKLCSFQFWTTEYAHY